MVVCWKMHGSSRVSGASDARATPRRARLEDGRLVTVTPPSPVMVAESMRIPPRLRNSKAPGLADGVEHVLLTVPRTSRDPPVTDIARQSERRVPWISTAPVDVRVSACEAVTVTPRGICRRETVTVPPNVVSRVIRSGGSVTVSATAALLPSDVAVMLAVPADTPVTVAVAPVADTVATVGALDAHVTVRPVSVAPAESVVVAVRITVAPRTTVGTAGVTATLATGTGDTVRVADPFTPSLLAVIVADPGATAVTVAVAPLAVMVATAVFPLLQVIARPASVPPAASRVTAVRVPVRPTIKPKVAGDTTTLATGGGVTVICAEPETPSAVADIVADPALTPVTSPDVETVATLGVALFHVMFRLSDVPPRSAAVACSWSVAPMITVPDDGLTLTVATAGGPDPPSPPPHASTPTRRAIRNRESAVEVSVRAAIASVSCE
jgi:hypothetical protein